MELDDNESNTLSAPSHFKHYTMEERKIVLQTLKRELQGPSKSYDICENSKQIDQAKVGQVPPDLCG